MAGNRIYLSPPHLDGDEILMVEEAFQSNWIAPLGPMVDKFESEIAEIAGVSSALALSSGTAAIHLALKLCGVEKGDLVFCSSFTFIGSCSPIVFLGAHPVFIDSEPESWNMSPTALEKAFEHYASLGVRPRAVIVVNLYGQMADYDSILRVCQKFETPVIEDAAESLGAAYGGRPSGSLGKYGIFSFNGNKIITTSGGGMLVSNDASGLEKARFWATQAREPFPWYEHEEIGYNYRMSNILAALGCGQLKHLSMRVETKTRINRFYREWFADHPVIGFMPEYRSNLANHWLSVLTIDRQKTDMQVIDIVKHMEELNIETRPVWKPMHLQPVFNGAPYFAHFKDHSFCDECYETAFCVPSGTSLTDEELRTICDNIKKIVDAHI